MKNFLRIIYAYGLFDDLILIYPLYVVMFSDYGLSTLEISIFFMVWSITIFLLEVPSGVLADKFPRKNLLIIGQLIRAIGYSIWLLIPNFTGFLIGFILWGIQGALQSGTLEALVYDELKKFRQEDLYLKTIGRLYAIKLAGTIVSAGLASLGMLLGYKFVLLLSIGAVLITAIIAVFIPKAEKTKSTHESRYWHILKNGFELAIKTPTILKTIIFMTLIGGIVWSLGEYWPLFLKDIKMPEYLIGITMAVLNSSAALGTFIAHKFKNKPPHILFLFILIGGISLIGTALLMNYIGLVLIALFTVTFYLVKTIFDARLQHAIPSETRATVTSIQNFISEIIILAVNATFGLIAIKYANRGSFFFFGIVVIILALIYLFFPKLYDRPKSSP